ncbi:ion channel [Neobacillus pocheonensis]|uniref:ion channel n=1 Tax=Neobacillus pocheonensis TaxID=363869 RepID=UPI003D2A14EC
MILGIIRIFIFERLGWTLVGMKLKKLLYHLVKLRDKIFIPFVLMYILLTALAVYLLEPKTFESYLTSVYWVLTTLATVGFGDYAPVTDLGKAFTIILYITGIGLISLVFGKVINSYYLIEKLKVGGKMKYSGKNHIILIGWSSKSNLAIKEILKTDKKIDIVIIDDLEKAPIIEDRLFYIRGDAADEETLLSANLPKAKGVIIFADQITQNNFATKDPLLVDGKTLLIATAITHIEEKLNISIHVTAEVNNQNHIRLFKHVKVDEFIPTQEMISHAAVRSLFSHGITNVYTELMSTQYEETMYEIPKKPEWQTYRDAFIDLLNKGATLVADRGDLHINQKLDNPIPADAQLFIICDKETITQLKPKSTY